MSSGDSSGLCTRNYAKYASGFSLPNMTACLADEVDYLEKSKEQFCKAKD